MRLEGGERSVSIREAAWMWEGPLGDWGRALCVTGHGGHGEVGMPLEREVGTSSQVPTVPSAG